MKIMNDLTNADKTEVAQTDPESQDMTSAVDEQDEPEGSSYNACIPLPDSMTDSVSEGDSFDGKITGTVITKDGKLSVEVETLNGEPVEKVEETDEEYTGKGEGDADMSGPEALDKFMKGRKVTQ